MSSWFKIEKRVWFPNYERDGFMTMPFESIPWKPNIRSNIKFSSQKLVLVFVKENRYNKFCYLKNSFDVKNI
jgi:hypothetical protein